MTPDDREWFSSQFDGLRKDFAVHSIDDEHRFTALESWRTAEVAASVSRGTWAGILAAASLTGLIEVLKVWFHR